jgi:T-complex protein 1 subunit gamma
MIELSRAQDESVGDGTTSVVILAGEALQLAEPLLLRNVHPTVIIAGYYRALEDAIDALGKCAIKLDPASRPDLERVVASCLGTKFVAQYGSLMVNVALDAVAIVRGPLPKAPSEEKVDIDLKKYARIEKIPGGDVRDTRVVRGVVLNKDVTHCKMRRRIERPRVVLLDCPLEYKKGESMTNVECAAPEDFAKLLKAEEEEVERMCADILRVKPDVVCTEKGVSDLAQHFLAKGGVSVLRRLRKTDNNRLARVSGATIAHRPEELQESDVGTHCALFDIQKIADEYFTFMTADEGSDARACTVVIRGANKDVMNEVERNLWDAMHVARNIAVDPRLVPGGGAAEMAVSHALTERAKTVEGVRQVPYRNVALSLEVIPRTLAQNCGADVVRTITELRAKHAQAPDKNWSWGIDGNRGVIGDMHQVGIWEPFEVKAQTIKSAIEAACLLLRVDDVLSGTSKKKKDGAGGAPTEKVAEDAELKEPAGH